MGSIYQHRRLAAAAAVVALVGSGVAYAYWTGGGTGAGSAAVGTSGTLTVTGTVEPGIAPGLTVPVTFTAANPSTASLRVGTVQVTAIEADAGHSACVTDDFSVADVVQDHPVPAGATAEPLPNDGTLSYVNTAVDQDACKGATLSLTLAVVV